MLLVSLLVAAGLVRSRGGPVREGEAILAEVRQKGLAAYWQPYAVRWYLIQAGGQVVGWRATVTIDRGGTAFEGIHVYVRDSARSDPGHWEWWRLNADATGGEYRAGKVVRSLLAWQIPTDTTIRLTGGQVFAKQVIQQWVLESQARTAANYLPEGTLELAARLVAERKTRAQFRLIFNEDLPLERTTRFRSIRLEYADPAGSKVPGAQGRVNLEILAGGEQPERAYFFDSGGGLVREIDGLLLSVLVDQEQVRTRFPDASGLVISVMQKMDFLFTPETGPSPLPFTSPQTSPGSPPAEPESSDQDDPML